MPSGIKERLSEILLKKGAITEEKLNQALQAQKEKGGSLGDILVSLGAISIPVTFLISSRAKTFSGSAIATVRMLPIFEIGMIW